MEYIGLIAALMFLPFILLGVAVDSAASDPIGFILTAVIALCAVFLALLGIAALSKR